MAKQLMITQVYQFSLSSDGSIVAIGAHKNNDNTGHVRVFKFS